MHTAYSCTACMPCSVSQEHVQDLIATACRKTPGRRRSKSNQQLLVHVDLDIRDSYPVKEFIYIYISEDGDCQDVM